MAGFYRANGSAYCETCDEPLMVKGIDMSGRPVPRTHDHSADE